MEIQTFAKKVNYKKNIKCVDNIFDCNFLSCTIILHPLNCNTAYTAKYKPLNYIYTYQLNKLFLFTGTSIYIQKFTGQVVLKEIHSEFSGLQKNKNKLLFIDSTEH